MSENVIVGFPDWSSTVTWAGGSYDAIYPVTNASDDEMARVARTADATNASTQLNGTLDSEQLVNLVALVLPNASIDAKAQIILKDAGGATLADSGKFDVFPSTYPTADLLWEDERFWRGKYRASDLKGTLWTRPYEFDNAVLAKTIEIDLFDSGNADGYLDIGYAAVAQSWQLGINPAPGAEFGFRSARTRSVRARGGAKTFDRLPKPNTWQGVVEIMERDEAMAQRYELDRQLDLDLPFIWWPYPDEPRHWPRTVFIARNRKISPLRHATSVRDHTEIPIDVEQVL